MEILKYFVYGDSQSQNINLLRNIYKSFPTTKIFEFFLKFDLGFSDKHGQMDYMYM